MTRIERLNWALYRFLYGNPKLHLAVRQPMRIWRKGTSRPILLGFGRGVKWVHLGRGMGYQNWLGLYEYSMQYALSKVLRPGDVFYDIGANLGFLTLVGRNLVGPGGQVFAFEPYSRVSQVLLRNSEANGFENVHLIQAAVGKKTGKAEFVTQAGSMGHLKGAIDVLPSQYSHQGESFTVDLIAIDDFVQAHPVPQVVKIDIEGAEIEALEGMTHLIEASGPVILGEYHSEQIISWGTHFLSSRGYRFFDVSNGLKRIETLAFWTLALPTSRTELLVDPS